MVKNCLQCLWKNLQSELLSCRSDRDVKQCSEAELKPQESSKVKAAGCRRALRISRPMGRSNRWPQVRSVTAGSQDQNRLHFSWILLIRSRFQQFLIKSEKCGLHLHLAKLSQSSAAALIACRLSARFSQNLLGKCWNSGVSWTPHHLPLLHNTKLSMATSPNTNILLILNFSATKKNHSDAGGKLQKKKKKFLHFHLAQ